MVRTLSHHDYSHTFLFPFWQSSADDLQRLCFLRNSSGKDLHFPGMSVGESEKEAARRSGGRRERESRELNSEKRSRCIDGPPRGRGLRKAGPGSRCRGRICGLLKDRARKGTSEQREKWHLSVCQGSRLRLLSGKRSDGMKAPRGKYRSFNITFVLHTVTQRARVHH